MKAIEGVQIIKGKTTGPTTVIVGGVHGNEPVGHQAIEYIHTQLSHTNNITGTIITLLGNPEATKANKRFIDTDLNRSFGDKPLGSSSIEYKRAQEIKDFFKIIPIDYMFDFHSTSSHSEPMILCTSQEQSKTLASLFPIQYVVDGVINAVEGVSLLNFFKQQTKVSIAFECGQHDSILVMELGKKLINKILLLHNGQNLQHNTNQITIKIDDLIFISNSNFNFTKPYKGFELIKKGEIWGTDTIKDYSWNEDKIIVMPNLNFKEHLEKKPQVGIAYFGKIIQ